MSDNDREKAPEHVRRAQEKFLKEERERDGEPDKGAPSAIDWKSGEPRNDPKHKP